MSEAFFHMTGPTLLVVTTDSALAREATVCVKGVGCRVRTRKCIDDALVELVSLPGIALVLLDDRLNDADALPKLRAFPGGAEVPVLVVYPGDTLDDAMAADMEAGVDACITRPLRCATIRAWVHMAERLQALVTTRREESKGHMDRVTEPLLRSAALAHAVSGPLQNLSSAIDLMELALPPDFSEQEQLVAMRRNLHRATEIVRGASEEARLALRRVNGDG